MSNWNFINSRVQSHRRGPPPPVPPRPQYEHNYHQPKLVFAHFMVGNTYVYSVEDWKEDILLAQKYDIDGFVLNVGKEEWQRHRVMDCFTAVSQVDEAASFKLFLSFDMCSIPGTSEHDVTYITAYLSKLGDHPHMLRNSATRGIVVSTFAGQECTFGRGSMEEGWIYAVREMERASGSRIHFVPALFIDPARYPHVHALSGIFHWNGAWPMHLTPSHPRCEIENPKLDSDNHHLHCLRKARGERKTYMASVSPWFFTHYGPESWDKNWIYRGDDWLYLRRWEQIMKMRNEVDIVQVISWNDYGESHYIGPIKGTQPNSQAWVDGYPHIGWLHLTSYLARAFKSGKYPDVCEDQIFMWARPHPKDAIANESIPKPDNWELSDDTLWIAVLSRAPATLLVYTSSDPTASPAVFNVPAGLSQVSCPLIPGGGMNATLERGGAYVALCTPVGYRFEERPGVWNWNAFVACSCLTT